MLMYMISKLVNTVFGLLYPAYASFIAVKTKDVRAYVQWMMYWIVFAFYTLCESFADVFIAPWFPFYYEIKIMLLLWLMAPATAGAGIIYRRFVHPNLIQYEPEIEICLTNIQIQTSSFVFQWAGRVFTAVTDAFTETFWNAAFRGGNNNILFNHLRRTIPTPNAQAVMVGQGEIGLDASGVMPSPERVEPQQTRSRPIITRSTPTRTVSMDILMPGNTDQPYFMDTQQDFMMEEIFDDEEHMTEEVEPVYKTRSHSRKVDVQESSIYGTIPRRKKKATTKSSSRPRH